MSEYDAIVVGSGPNGLVAALTMAEAGRRVLLLEGAERFGGGLRSAELTLPGFTHDVCATVLALSLASRAFRDRLPDLGVEFAQPEVPAAHPLDDGPAVLIHRDPAATAAGLGRDGRAWQASIGATARAGFPLVDTLLSPLGLPRAPLAAARYGALGALPATILARSLFRTAPARAAFAGMAAHSMLDLRAPITGGYGMMLASLAHSVGWPVVRGGSQVLADLLVERLRKLGAETVSGQRVTSLRELPPAGTVLLDLPPRRFLQLADLPPGYARRLGRFRHGPGVFKIDWALDGPVPWRDPEISRAGTVHLGGTLEEITASETAVAQGRPAVSPYVLVVQAGVADPTRAPAGKQTLWAYCHVPNGSDYDMAPHIEAQLERFAPGFRDRVLARHVMPPAAMQSHNPNYIGGDIGGGAADLGQFFGRPLYSLKPWRTPLKGVYLCSASTPPGAGVHGMSGHHAARLALKDLRSGRARGAGRA
ncbi:NAD(P)/FAD-dependent oxidoreductase [Acrocarpospora sp. B8E8]|uniref:phytoene desaturase family protein n=1 Tax=Acrocarpospora sp. B8E8 TaxID=3153572 RepID=UPI00325C3828